MPSLNNQINNQNLGDCFSELLCLDEKHYCYMACDNGAFCTLPKDLSAFV